MAVTYLILHGFNNPRVSLSVTLKLQMGLYVRHSATRPEKFTRRVLTSRLVPLSLAFGSGVDGSILKEPQAKTLSNRLNQL